MMVAILARSASHAMLRELIPNAQLFAPGAPRLGQCFDRVYVFFKPVTPEEEEWVAHFVTALGPDGWMEYLL